MFDDLVAAVCALLVLALGVAVRDRGVLATCSPEWRSVV